MKSPLIRLLLFFFFSWGILLSLSARKRDSLTSKNIEFVENKNQWNDQVLYKAKINNGAIFAERDGITYMLLNTKQLDDFYTAKRNPQLGKHSGKIDAAAYKMKFLGANPDVIVNGKTKYPHYHNYYHGNDPSKWASFVSLFQSVHYQNLYHGIDLVLHQQEGFFKYELIVGEGSSPGVIEMEYEGVNALSLSNQNLIVTTNIGQVIELKPFAYQINSEGDTINIECKYHLQKNRLSFKIGKYDRERKLIIDPVLIFASYSGSTADNWGYTATYDSQGNLIGGGIAFNIGYPTTTGAFQIDWASGQTDIAITKFNPNGTTLLFSTYLGGNSVEVPNSMVVNDNDELYVLGTTGSSDFPMLTDAYCTTFNGGISQNVVALEFPGTDITLSKFSVDGTQLLASTYIGGSANDGINSSYGLKYNYADESRGEVVIDGRGNVCVVSSTFSTDFPITESAFQQQHGGGQDACLFKFNHNLTNLIFSSYLGGSRNDAGYSLVTANDNSIYLCGGTNSLDFPVTPECVQDSFAGSQINTTADGFITHVNEFGTQILHSTYLGTAYYDQTYLIKNDKYNNPHVFGQTSATGNEWIRNATWHQTGGGQFVTKLNPELNQIIWSTAFGTGNGGPDISPTALAVDLCNNIYMSGWGSRNTNGFGGTSGLPITADALQHTTDNNDYYFICISDDASSLKYATFFGDPYSNEHVDGGTSRFDKKGNIYQAVCAGCGGSSDFPTTPGAWSQTNNSVNCNLGVIKIDFMLPAIVADFNIPNVICLPNPVNTVNLSYTISTSTSYEWDFGDGATSTLVEPSHHYTASGIYTVTLIISDLGSCNFSDTLSKEILVLANSHYTLPPISLCKGDAVQIGFPDSDNPDMTYSWYPITGLDNPNISNPIATPEEATYYYLFISNGVCTDTIIQFIEVVDIAIALSPDTAICLGDTIELSASNLSPTENISFFWSTSPNFTNIINANPTTSTIRISPEESTTYYLKVATEECTLFFDVNVRVSSIVIHDNGPLTHCFQNAMTIAIDATCVDCAEIYYSWAADPSIVSGTTSASLMILPTENTTYYVTISNSEGCIISDSIYIIKQVNTFPHEISAWSNRNTIKMGDTTMLYATLFPEGEYSYSWTPAEDAENPNTFSTIITPPESTVYTVVITDHFGCSKLDTVKITVEPVICGEPYIFIPNAFTPNGDQYNEILYVRGEIIDDLLFRIYNRWGEMVFETRDQTKGWDGTYKNADAPQGVYDYYLDITCKGNATFSKKGNITLIR